MRHNGPDFLCIGMPKAGTGWLFDQLSAHPDFWMPPIKEFHYLDKPFPALRSATDRLVRFEQLSRPWRKGTGRAHRFDERDLAFLKAASAAGGKRRDLDIYASLFDHKGDKLSGDITPRYAVLGDAMIAKVGERLPDTKVVLIVRDPVSRALSRISMSHRNGNFDDAVLADGEAPVKLLESASYLQDRSSPTAILDAWKRCAPDMNLRYFFFDDLATRAEKLHAEIVAFLGADPSKPVPISIAENRKRKTPKLEFDEKAVRIVAEHYRDELRACKILGGPAEGWAAKYGV
jgi:sulfotransferase family protein